jgi:hypothetical protein
MLFSQTNNTIATQQESFFASEQARTATKDPYGKVTHQFPVSVIGKFWRKQAGGE